MSKIFKLALTPCEHIETVKGVPFPAKMRFRQLLVTGPPGSGKSLLMETIGGWPEEGFIDLTLKNWWRARSLALRPREVHLGLPVIGYPKALSVIDPAWIEAPEAPRLDRARIVMPPERKRFTSIDWRNRFYFEFSLPPPRKVLAWRLKRRCLHSHPPDETVNLEQVKRQIAVYREVALFFHQAGMLVYIRNKYGGMPKYIVGPKKRS